VAVSREARTPVVPDVARALRRVAEREAHHVVFSPAGSLCAVQFTTDPGVFWGEIVAPWPMKPGSRAGRQCAAGLRALGWREPAGHIPNWFQYFHPTRKRHYRTIAQHVLDTLEHGLDERPAELTVEVDPSPPAPGPTFVLDEADDPGDLLDIAERVLSGFSPERYPTHLELTMQRSRHQVRIAVSVASSTVTCAALYLPAVEPDVADAALAVSDMLDRVPHTYGLRTVTGHGDSLVLLGKFAVLQPDPFVLGIQLYNMIESLVAAHRALLDRPPRGGRY
jgi:hypothetical protein